jgi:hypothetical protein
MFGASRALTGHNVPIHVRTQTSCVAISLSLHEVTLLKETDLGAAMKLAEMMVDWLQPNQIDNAARQYDDNINANKYTGSTSTMSQAVSLSSRATNGTSTLLERNKLGLGDGKLSMPTQVHRGSSFYSDESPEGPIASRSRFSSDDFTSDPHSTHQKHDKASRRSKWEAAKLLGEGGSEQQITLLLTSDSDSVSRKILMYGASTDAHMLGARTNINTGYPSKGMFQNVDSSQHNKRRLLEDVLTTEAASSASPGPTERLSEIQRHELKQALKMVQDAWMNISMGSSCIVSSQLLALQPHLGEAGSELFKALFIVSDMPEVCSFLVHIEYHNNFRYMAYTYSVT